MTPTGTTTLPYWQTPSPSLPYLEGTVRADCCVVGLGGSGLAAIHSLLDTGHSVVGIDAQGIAGGAAGRNGGFLLAGVALFHHEAIERFGRGNAVELYRLTQQQLRRMVEETPAAVDLRFSIRRAADDGEIDDCRAELRAFEHDGIEADWYEGPEGVGLKIYGDGCFHPQQRALTRAGDAVARGARLFVHSPAIDVRTGEVHTPRGTVRCRSVIVAVDGGLTRIFPELDGRIRTVRLQMLATEPDHRLRISAPVYSRYGHDYWQQRPDGQILIGGGRDLAGAAEQSDDPTVTDFIQDYLTTILRNDIGTQARVTHRWAGIVSYSDDDLPILEEVRPQVVALGAYSGTGNVLGAAAGREAAAWVDGQKTPLVDLLRSIRQKMKTKLKAAS